MSQEARPELQILTDGPVPPLPPPAERQRLREAWGWSRPQLAVHLGVGRDTVWGWEQPGAPVPRGAKGQRYARLLHGISSFLESGATVPAMVPPVEPVAAAPSVEPGEPMPAVPQPEPEPEPEPEPAPEPAPAALVPDPAAGRSPAAFSDAVADEPGTGQVFPDGQTYPCVRCGRPTAFHFHGEPRHLFLGLNSVVPPCWLAHGARPVPPELAEHRRPAAVLPAAPVEAVPAAVEPVADPGRTALVPPRAPGPAPAAPAVLTAPAARVTVARALAAPGTVKPVITSARYTDGPLAVLDVDGGKLVAHLVDGRALPVSGTKIPAVAAWTMDHTRIGAEAIKRNGKDADPLLYLTAAATELLGLPLDLVTLGERQEQRLDPKHPVLKQIKRAGWEMTGRGFGPWPKVFQRPADGSRRSVQFAVLPWGALEKRVWKDTETQPAAEIARRVGLYAQRVITPRVTMAVTGQELMLATRPPTRAVKDASAPKGYSRGLVPGALHEAVDPAPPEAPEEHPIVHETWPNGRPANEVLDEEAHQWVRPYDLITDEEKAMPFVVGLDLITAFLSATNGVRVGLGPPVLVHDYPFDKDMPGSWWEDLSQVEVDPRLPNPFTSSGRRPEGPRWHATDSIAYALELGADIRPQKAYIRPENGLYLTPWYYHLRNALIATMADLGVHEKMGEQEFLDAMARHKQGDPGLLVVLNAIKATAKNGIGKLAERPQYSNYVEGTPWRAMKRETWRPDIRHQVLSKYKNVTHRKIAMMAELTGRYPLAILTDCVVYASPGPSPLDILPHMPDGSPAKGTFRLGVNPGLVKAQGAEPMSWALPQLEKGVNIANYISDAVEPGE